MSMSVGRLENFRYGQGQGQNIFEEEDILIPFKFPYRALILVRPLLKIVCIISKAINNLNYLKTFLTSCGAITYAD